MLLRIPFYREFGIRKQAELATPVLHLVNELGLPRDSLYHHFPTEPISIGMDLNDPIFNGYESKFVQMFHVTQYTDEEPAGRFRYVTNELKMMQMEFHRKNRFFRFTRDWKAALDNPRMLTVFNYAPLDLVYRYMDAPLTVYMKWKNRYRTLWSTIAKVAKETDRHQYVILDIPAVQPAVTRLMKYEADGMSTVMLASGLDSDDKFVVADFWTWLGHNRTASAIHQVDEKDLNKVNVIFMEMGRWTVVNLGILNSWRQRDDDEPALDIELIKELNKGIFSTAPAIDQLRLQRRMLRFFMALNEGTLSTTELEEVEELSEEEPVRDENGELVFNREQTAVQPKDAKPVINQGNLKPSSVSKQKGNGKTNLTSDDGLVVEDGVDEETVYTDEDIERDLERLEEVAASGTTGTSVAYEPYVPPSTALEAGVMTQADELVKKGLLSPAQHRRMEKLANRYKELPNPYGEGKLTDLLTIPKDDVVIEETNKVVDAVKGVGDQSFLSSSLKTFDQRYTDKVLRKDVAKMALNLQKAGIAVQSYEVTREEDINDNFEIHSIRVQPVVGAPSTLRFRLPVIDKNGNFVAGGVTSRVRKQRGDLPIRKIGPDEVALTSYYSKLFVHRAERMVFNFEAWLCNQITARGINDEDTTVTELRFGKPFTNDIRLPRHYTILAKTFLGFRSGDYTFDFNWKKREEVFGTDLVKLVDTRPELVLCGHHGKLPIVMDMESKLYTVTVEGKKLLLKPIHDILSIVGIERSKAPVEIAEVGIFAKVIPVGFVLAYITGLGDLLETLKVPYRRVKTRSHYQMEDDEFDVRFEDETLVFKRTHLAMMIFGGFNRYHRDIKRISIYAFDKKDVYSSVLANNNIGVRSLKEMDLMFKLWVDHITEEILVEMGEPTDLFNLFISAVKKLEYDDHPDIMDNRFMRDKGYERFAGIAYTEMVKAMRVYAGKPQNDKATVDLNPEAVWHTILGDATVMQVEDSNPIGNLQEKEVIVYRGEGGRSARSMTVKTRGYHKSSLGVVSEAGVDKGDVGTVIYTSADPSYKSVRGLINPVEKVDGNNNARILSTSTLMGPWTTTDD